MTDERNSNGTVEFNSRFVQDDNGLVHKNKLTSHDDLNKTENNNFYQPYDHRDLQHPNTYFGAVVHIIKGSLGIGIFSVPRAFKTAGLLVGTIGTLLIGTLCTYNIHLLVRASHKICERTKTPSLGFSETIEAIFLNGPQWIRKFAPYARIFVEISLTLTYYLSTAVYTMLISESLSKLISVYYPPAKDWDLYFKLIAFVLLCGLCQIRELKHLVPFSLTANILLTVTFGITLYYMILNLQEVDLSERQMFRGFRTLPSFFSTVLFSIEGIGTIMPVENSMVVPKFLGPVGVLNVAMFCVVGLYTMMGFFGYLAFGEDTKAAITQNLPSNGIPAQIVQACITLAMFLTFMLILYVPTEIIWKRLGPAIPKKRHNIAQIVLRISSVGFVIFLAAVAGHNMDIVIDLTGAVFFSILGILVPATTDLLVHWDNWGCGNYILWKNIVLYVVFVFFITSGTTVALGAI